MHDPDLIRSSDALRAILQDYDGPRVDYRRFHAKILDGDIPGATRLKDGSDGRLWWIVRALKPSRHAIRPHLVNSHRPANTPSAMRMTRCMVVNPGPLLRYIPPPGGAGGAGAPRSDAPAAWINPWATPQPVSFRNSRPYRLLITTSL
jgi:hypothetical protein